MQNELRKRQNSAVYEEQKNINRQIVNKMFSQLDLWREEIPKSRAVSFEETQTIEDNITELIAILNEKLTAIDTLIFKNKSVEDLFTKIIYNNDFLSKYNSLIKPLTQSKNQALKTAIETQLQLLIEPLERILIAYKALLKDTKLINLSRVSSVFNAYALYKLVHYQIDVSQYKIINNELLNSSKADAKKDLTLETRNILDTVKEQYNLAPSERKKVFIQETEGLEPQKVETLFETEPEEEQTELPEVPKMGTTEEEMRDYYLGTTERIITADLKRLNNAIKEETAKGANKDVSLLNLYQGRKRLIKEIVEERKQAKSLVRESPKVPKTKPKIKQSTTPIKKKSRFEEGMPA